MTTVMIELDGKKCTIETDRADMVIDDLFEDYILPCLRGIGYTEESVMSLLHRLA